MDEVASLVIKVLSEQVETATKRLATLENQSRETEREVKKLGAVNFKAVAAELAAYGVGIATLKREVDAAVSRWVEFDTAIKKVGSVATFTGGQFRQLRKETLALSAALGVDATKAAEGLYEAFQADIPKENAIDFLATATKTSIGGVTSVTSAVNSLTNVINAYGMDVGRAEEISDKLFATVLYGKASFDQLGTSLSGAAVPAAAMGVKFEEVLSMIAQITSQGTSTNEAITQIERSITALINPTEEMNAVFRQLGVESGRAAIAQYGLVGTLEQVRKAYSGNDAALVKAMGSVIAMSAVLGTTGSKLDNTADKLDKVTNSAGNNERAFRANGDTVGAAINSIKSSVTALVEEMENSFGIIAKFSEALRGISGLMKEVSSGSFTPDTRNAMGLGGQSGVMATLDQLDKLKAKQQELIKTGADASKATDAYRKANFGYLPELFTNAGARNAELAQTNKEVEALAKNLESTDDHTKAFGQINYEVNKLVSEQKKATDPIAVEGYTLRIQALRDEYAQLEGEVAGVAKAETDKKTATVEAAKAEDAVTAQRLKQAGIDLELAEEKKKSLIKTGTMAEDLATSEIEKLRQKQALIREAMASKDAESKLDEMVGTKAIANLDQQIKLLEEKDKKTAGGAAGGGGVGAGATGFSALELPEINDPFDSGNLFEQLAKDEAEIAKSYARRREAILNETRLTEEQRLALLNEASEKYKSLMIKADEQRLQATLKTASDTFGQLASIAGAFGKKGAAMAKGFAIMQATIDMISAAQAAYKATVGIPYVGPYIAPVAAAAALAVGAGNIAKIKATEYSGAYEHGGMIPAGKFGVAGEAGPELVNGPAVVTSARTTAAAMRGGSNDAPRTRVVVHNYGNDRIEERRSQNGEEELVEFIVGQASQRVADDIAKGGTSVSKAMERKYSLTRGKSS